MAQSGIAVTPYEGALLATDLLAGSTNVVLGNFGASETGTLVDNDGTLSTADDGKSTFNGDPVTYIGSGQVTPGIEQLGIFLPLGPSKDVVVFEAGGQAYFHYPEGPPSATGSIVLNVDITSEAHSVFTPPCFTSGTRILTPAGPRPVEALVTGDTVLDEHGTIQEIIWTGARRLRIPELPAYDKWHPVRIAPGAFGPGRPTRTTWLSQQHRVLVEGWKAELHFGEPRVLVAAKALVNDRDVVIDRTQVEVGYHHLMCREHAVLLADGLPAESLFPGCVALDGLAAEARDEILEIFPELGRGEIPADIETVLPVVTPKAGQVLAG
ncbi:Hint domain-containing protein [Roseovarius salinarum]|uniref:Hint domain-containing protein n=1 Tax=Roseovarius salinarum TaxID=1981892 RepID=UPI000C33BDDC|nr:Hint domain-containing protein [Roseovarius salinarum]